MSPRKKGLLRLEVENHSHDMNMGTNCQIVIREKGFASRENWELTFLFFARGEIPICAIMFFESRDWFVYPEPVHECHAITRQYLDAGGHPTVWATIFHHQH